MGAEVLPRATSMKPYFDALDQKMGVAIRESQDKINEARKYYLGDEWKWDSVKVSSYSPRTNCNSCAAPIRYSRCEYCGCETGLTARMPLSNSEKIRIEQQLISAVNRQLPKRGLLERVFDRYIYAIMGIR